jgi:hypothetical protein
MHGETHGAHGRRILRCAARRASPALATARRRSGRATARARATDGSHASASREAEARTDAARKVAQACAALAAGLDVWAKHLDDAAARAAARDLALEHRALVPLLASETGAFAGAAAAAFVPRTCDRLRWEWLASTSALLDGAPDARLLAECARLVDDARNALRVLERDAATAKLAARVGAAFERVRRASASASARPLASRAPAFALQSA